MTVLEVVNDPIHKLLKLIIVTDTVTELKHFQAVKLEKSYELKIAMI